MTGLTDAEKTDVRRFCGYPAYGSGATGFQTWRFNMSYGQLEYRINNLSQAELGVVRRYIATLVGMELAIPRSGESMDTDQASMWTRNKDEPHDRVALFEDWSRRLCGFLGCSLGPALRSSAISIVV